MFFHLLARRAHYRRFTKRLHVDMRRRFREALLWLLALLVLHTVAMRLFESLGWADAAWLTLTTVTTVGYGDLSATTAAGRLATVVLLYVAGISLLAQLASEYIELRIGRKTRMIEGRWEWKMKDHLLIVHSPATNAGLYFKRLVSQLRETAAFVDTPVQLVTDAFPDGLPAELRDMGVVHRHADASDPAELAVATPADARAIIVLARDEYSRVSDSINLDVLLQLERLCGESQPMTLVECVAEDNRQRAAAAGATATLRPVRAYPEILVRALVAPGSEKILENLFTHHDDHAMRYDLTLADVEWAEAVCRVMRAGLGTLMAYVGPEGEVVTHPAHDHRFDARAVIIMVRAEAVPRLAQVRDVLAAPEARD